MKLYPSIASFFIFTLFVISVFAHDASDLGGRLERYSYPFPVKNFSIKTQNQTFEMAYMDLQSKQPNGETVLLLHGKNFTAAYWEKTANFLTGRGYRVVMPDQIGFGKSSKPAHYQYSFHTLASNTLALLDHLEIQKTHVLGHSMGGMLATRFVLMYPQRSESLILENPIGLEDWKTLVPYQGLASWYKSELSKTPESIRKYQLESYYDGEWKAAYDPWVNMLAGMIKSEDYPAVAWNQALTYDMIFTQPVVYEFPLVKVPTILIIGQRDRTALGKGSVPKEIAKTMGDYPMLGKKVAKIIPNATLVEIDDIGHLPHIEAFNLFIKPLIAFLEIE